MLLENPQDALAYSLTPTPNRIRSENTQTRVDILQRSELCNYVCHTKMMEIDWKGRTRHGKVILFSCKLVLIRIILRL